VKKTTILLILMILFVLGLIVSGTLTGAEKVMVKSEYVGSDKCKVCHKVPYDSWKLTYHSKMVRKKDEGILKDVVDKWKTDGYAEGPTTGNVTGRKFTINDVQYVIGSNWKQRFLVKDETTGGYQFLNKQFNRMSGRWENYGQKNDWDTMCATCHTTGYRLTQYDPKKPKAQKGEFSELNIGCESCHGPGNKHVKSKSKKDIWNFAGKTKEEQARVCGYCHIRLENEKYKSAQGNPREDFPAPNPGQSFKPSDDWTKWYPDHVIIPGVQPKHPFNAEYKGDLKGLFIVDDISRANGVYEEAKHHQEYQGFIQSKHYKTAGMACMDCHSPHATNKMARKDPTKICIQCHDETYTYTKYMPGTGKTADNLFVRSHTFIKNQKRPNLPTDQGEPVYYK
jgi:predicted CXXCH cytochrome family protein